MFEFSIDNYNIDNIKLCISDRTGEKSIGELKQVECYSFNLDTMSYNQTPNIIPICNFQADSSSNSVSIGLEKLNGLYKFLIKSATEIVGEVEEYIGSNIEVRLAYENISINTHTDHQLDGIAVTVKANTNLPSNLVVYRYKNSQGGYTYKLPIDEYLYKDREIKFFIGNICRFNEIEFTINEDIYNENDIFVKYLKNHIKFKIN